MSLQTNVTVAKRPGPECAEMIQKESPSSVFLLADENTRRHCYPLLAPALDAISHQIIEIKSGETHKNLDTCQYIWQQLTDHQADRHALLINLGGGVIGDMGGFCAATYKRGISFVQMPTTLLAQADASIGGKLGIDFLHYKNHIGVFKAAKAVLSYTDMLHTLPERQLLSGFAEVIKHSLIADAALWQKLSGTARLPNPQEWLQVVKRAIEIKQNVVEQDPYEKNVRKWLNLGHTIGHAIESYALSHGGDVLHGEAVAAGIICETFVANRQGRCSEDFLKETSHYLITLFGKVAVPQHTHEAVAALCTQDKKNKGHHIRAVLPEAAGKVQIDCPITKAEVKEALTYYNSL